MRAVVIENGKVVVRERPDPEPGPGELLVRVAAAGLNGADLVQVAGFYPPPPGIPEDIPGMELAGIVVACGDGCQDFKVGDGVMSIVGGAAQAELVLVPEATTMRVPEGLSWEEAGGFCEAAVTAHDALVTQGWLRGGDRVLVTGAAGGVGSVAVQIAVLSGAEVVASVHRPELREKVAAFGPAVVDPNETESHGPYDLVLELVSAANLGGHLHALAPKGRIVVIGVGQGSKTEIDLLQVMRKQAVLRGSTLRHRSPEEKAMATRLVAREVLPFFAERKLRVPVEGRYSLAEVTEAYERFSAGGKLGKIVLLPAVRSAPRRGLPPDPAAARAALLRRPHPGEEVEVYQPSPPSEAPAAATVGAGEAGAVTGGAAGTAPPSARPPKKPRSRARKKPPPKEPAAAVAEVPTVKEGDLLFEPTASRRERAQVTAFMKWLKDHKGIEAASYGELHEWSVRDVAGFWRALAEWDGVVWRTPPDPDGILVQGNGAEGAKWFAGSELNYVDHVIRHTGESPAVVAVDETGRRRTVTYSELAFLAGAAAAGLRKLGVEPGDRVAAVLPNGLEAIVSFLATASLGAIWSSCAPEFGTPSMADRFRQIRPKVLLVANGYRYGGKVFSLLEKSKALTAILEDVEAVVRVPTPGVRVADHKGASARTDGPKHLDWAALLSEQELLNPVAVGFDHPLWILYSSGTTGLPKPIVQGHGGIVLEHVKAARLHSDFGPGERAFWFSTTGWMMWNFLLGGLLTGATIVCYDGSPAHPDHMALWRMAASEGVTYFGTSAPFIETCRRTGLAPRTAVDLSAVHSIGSTGAPLPPEGFAWASTKVGDDVLVGSVSGGTDVCTAFLHTSPLLPVYAGELQCAALGCEAIAANLAGEPVVGEVGELVLTTPMPSMPVGFWGDDDGTRLHDSYFADFPGRWRHGDWVKKTARGTFVVYGRSDATLNRGGVRMGTAEFYRIVEALDGVVESLVVDTSELGREGELILVVVLGAGAGAPEVAERIRSALRESVSPRHVPDRILFASALPRTLNGKRVEVPLRRILLGTAPEAAVSRDSLADPEHLDEVLASLREAGLL